MEDTWSFESEFLLCFAFVFQCREQQISVVVVF